MSEYSDCFNKNDIVYCKIGNGDIIVGTNSSKKGNNGVVNGKLFTFLEIPKRVNGYKITEIGFYAFRGQTNLISVKINAEIEQINYGAFYSCESLVSINIPSSVKYIGNGGISCVSTTGGTTSGTLTVTFDYPSSIKFIGNFSLERKEYVIVYFGGFVSPCIYSNLFQGCTKAIIYSPESIKFDNYTTIGLHKDFFC